MKDRNYTGLNMPSWRDLGKLCLCEHHADMVAKEDWRRFREYRIAYYLEKCDLCMEESDEEDTDFSTF
jgi:hypothetical protein